MPTTTHKKRPDGSSNSWSWENAERAIAFHHDIAGAEASDFVANIVAGAMSQDVHIDKVVVSLENAPTSGKTVTVTVGNGTSTISVAVADTAVGGSSTTNHFDFDVSAETLTIAISSTSGTAAGCCTILVFYHDITITNPPVAIDIGEEAKDRGLLAGSWSTRINKGNPANASGIITSVEIWAHTDMSGVKVGIFTANGDTLKCRSAHTIGDVIAGSKQTFSELSLSVEAGDYIGLFWTDGQIEDDPSGGGGLWYKYDDHCIVNDEATYLFGSGDVISLYGIGVGE